MPSIPLAMTPLYAFLNDTRPSFIGPKHWLGSLRWFAQEEKEPGSFAFKTAPMDATEQERCAAPLETWVDAVVNFSEAELAEFYREYSRPTVNLYEQAFFLHALRAMEKLALGRGEPEVAKEAREKFDHLLRVLEERHGNEADGFYYDWDVRAKRQTRAMNQDAFYLLRFLNRPARVQRVIAHLNNPDEFALRHIPTLAKNAEGFRPDGYWCGGFWPRESAYIGDALREAGDLQ